MRATGQTIKWMRQSSQTTEHKHIGDKQSNTCQSWLTGDKNKKKCPCQKRNKTKKTVLFLVCESKKLFKIIFN